jgi:acylphosphatase
MVQGVGFRYFVKRNAILSNIVGYVENLPDERVHVVCEGSKEALLEFIEVLRRGNSYSVVKSVDFLFGVSTGEFSSFEAY